jgi:hypothetical protein
VVESFLREFEAFEKAVNGERSEVATAADGLLTVQAAASAGPPASDSAATVGGEAAPAPQSLSVVVVTVESGDRLRVCLDSLVDQADASEVIVPWDGSHGPSAALQRDYPSVEFVPVGPGKLTFAQLRAQGIARAAGDVIAITEDHFTPASDWAQQILEAHRAPYPAIGGAVDKDTPDGVLSWAFYLADYLRYLDPAEGPSPHLTDGNVSYKREALRKIQSLWATEFHENVVHAALTAGGQPLWLSPRIVVRQKRAMTLRAAVRDRYAFGRLFGSTRVEGMPASARLKLTVICLLLPAVLLMRIASHVVRTRRYTGAFLRALPALLLISTVWAWGELVGYLTARPDETLSARTEKTLSARTS